LIYSPVFRIGAVPVEPPLILAPMAGITDRDFRLLIRRLGGCGLVVLEGKGEDLLKSDLVRQAYLGM
jgi:tRNA-dihydrouridine synthase B